MTGFRSALPDTVPATGDHPSNLIVGERTVRLYEVYWADVLGEDVAKGAFELADLSAVVWLPRANRRAGRYRPGDYSLGQVILRTLELVPIGLASGLLYLGGNLLTTPVLVKAWDRPHTERKPGEGVWALTRRTAEEGREVGTPLDPILDRGAGDVFSYVNSATGGLPEASALRGKANEILERFHAALQAASADRCSEVQIVAHSLGSVIAYHGLTGYAVESWERSSPPQPPAGSEQPVAVTRLYTIGSPLEKFRFLWPRLIPSEAGRSSDVANGQLRWDNFYSPFDVVSGKIKHFDDWNAVTNHRVAAAGFLRSHTIYERSGPFLEVLTEGLVGTRARPPVGPWQRIVAGFLTAFENLAAPLLIAAVCLVGLALIVGLGWLIGFVLALPFQLVGLDGLSDAIHRGTTIAATLLMTLTSLIPGRSNATEAPPAT